jgi:hypothetical protein
MGATVGVAGTGVGVNVGVGVGAVVAVAAGAAVGVGLASVQALRATERSVIKARVGKMMLRPNLSPLLLGCLR